VINVRIGMLIIVNPPSGLCIMLIDVPGPAWRLTETTSNVGFVSCVVARDAASVTQRTTSATVRMTIFSFRLNPWP
jgi:hypothetical protein